MAAGWSGRPWRSGRGLFLGGLAQHPVRLADGGGAVALIDQLLLQVIDGSFAVCIEGGGSAAGASAAREGDAGGADDASAADGCAAREGDADGAGGASAAGG